MTVANTKTRRKSKRKTESDAALGIVELAGEEEAIEKVKMEENSAGGNGLEDSGEIEPDGAQIVDSELHALLKTPAGLRGAIEAILFASPDPLGPRRIANICGLDNTRMIRNLIEQIRIDYDKERRGFQINETAGGYQMATLPMFADLILRLRNRKRRPALSPAALETLAIIAYRGPVIRAEIEAVRGVESSGTIRNLIDMGLVEMAGRKDVIGRPPMYATTDQFLRTFGLKSRRDLPPIAELKKQLIMQQESEEQMDAADSPENPSPDDRREDVPVDAAPDDPEDIMDEDDDEDFENDAGDEEED
jgi:segregation and condensation protein B